MTGYRAGSCSLFRPAPPAPPLQGVLGAAGGAGIIIGAFFAFYSTSKQLLREKTDLPDGVCPGAGRGRRGGGHSITRDRAR